MTDRKRMTRRFFLGGAGVAISLPFLPSLVTRGVRAEGETVCTAPKRFLAYYVPCGIHMAAWTPSATGATWSLTPILQPLENVKEDILVLSRLRNDPARPDGPGDHASGTGAFLTCAHPFKTEGADIRNGISVDQVMANNIGSCTRFPSLQLGTDGGGSTGGCDSGYSCAYARNVSWAGPSTPVAKQTDPGAIFDRLFGGFDPTATRAEILKRRAYQTSVLDYALEQASALETRLSVKDRIKLDEFMTAVREVETRIEGMASGPLCEVPGRPSDGDIVAKIDVLTDLMVLAFQCDMTRVITYMQGNAGNNRAYNHLGISEGHHELSHHQGNAENHRKLQIIDTWEVSTLAALLEKLKATEDFDGNNLLYNTAVFFSSEIEDGNSHAHRNLPVILAGHLGGVLSPNRHIAYADEPPLANMFVSILNGMGIPETRFGDSTGTLPLLG